MKNAGSGGYPIATPIFERGDLLVFPIQMLFAAYLGGMALHSEYLSNLRYVSTLTSFIPLTPFLYTNYISENLLD
jgi:hypothetical protein